VQAQLKINTDELHRGDGLTSGVLVMYSNKSSSLSCLALGVFSCGVICPTGTSATHSTYGSCSQTC